MWRRNGRRFTALLPIVLFAVSAPATAAPPPAVPVVGTRPVYNLKRCLQLAALNYPKVHEARAKLAYKRAQLSQAKTAPFSEFTATAGLGLAPTVSGTSVYSPFTDASISSNMGLAWQVGIEGAIPLWTFGKLSNLWDAAEAQVSVGEHELKKEQNDVKLSVRRAYYGVQLSRDSLALLREAVSRIDRYLVRLDRRVRDGEGDDIELLKLRMYRAELDARES